MGKLVGKDVEVCFVIDIGGDEKQANKTLLENFLYATSDAQSFFAKSISTHKQNTVGETSLLPSITI